MPIVVYNGLNKITIPSSITIIKGGAFASRSSITEIVIPKPVICKSLKNTSIHSSAIEIGYGAFSSCSSLTQIAFPPSVHVLIAAFSRCSSLTQAMIPPTTSMHITQTNFTYFSSGAYWT